MSISSKGSSIASIAALMAMSMSTAFAADMPNGSSGAAIGASDKVHCYNVNTCKGSSDCKTAEHQCKGQNVCKGHGFKAMGAKACLDAGGTVGDIK